MEKKNIPMIVDPAEQYLRALEMLGYDVIDEYLSMDTMAIDCPTGSEEEFLRHYILGAGGPFTDFVVGVDVGVGFTLKPIFENKEEGEKAKKRLEEFYEKIDFLSTMTSFATYYEVLGRATIVLTSNALGDDFYQNEHLGITGIDCINPMTFEIESIYKALEDPNGKEPFIQVYTTHAGKNERIPLPPERVIYATRNKLARKSAIGISMYQNALRELRAIIKFPRFRESIARKLANVFRHYTIDQEAFKNTALGRAILTDENAERNYLLSIQKLIMEQESKHSSIATFKWVESNEKTYGGNEPNLEVVEKQNVNMLALKFGIPANIMAYAEDVNRSTLETIAEFFVQRRKNGSQKEYKTIIESISNLCMEKWGFKGRMEIEFNTFVQENEASKMERVGLFNQRCPDVLGVKEQREILGRPDEIDRGKSDEQVKEKRLEDAKAALELQMVGSDNPENRGGVFPEEKTQTKTTEETNNKETETNLSQMKNYLRDLGLYRDVET